MNDPQPLKIGRDRPRLMAVAIATLLALGGFGLVFYTTEGDNQRADPDSPAYLDGAYFMRHGRGYIGRTFPGSIETSPITHWPPAYPAALAVGAMISNDEVVAARWINGMLFALLILSVGHLVWHAGKNHAAMSVACGLCLIYWPFLKVHVFIWSEPLFLVGLLYAMVGVFEYLRGGGRLWLAQAAFFAGLAAMTRYAGVAVIAAVGLCLLWLDAGRPWRGRLARAAIVCSAAAVAPLLWAVRNFLVAGSSHNRTFGFDLPDVKLMHASHTVANWVWPLQPQSPLWMQWVLFAGLCGVVVWVVMREARRVRSSTAVPVPSDAARLLALICAAFAVNYTVLIIAAVTLVDHAIPMTDRILCPLLLCALVGGCALAGRTMSMDAKTVKAAVLTGLLVLTAMTAARGMDYAARVRAGADENPEMLIRREIWSGERGLR